jgi:hypothetical protein
VAAAVAAVAAVVMVVMVAVAGDNSERGLAFTRWTRILHMLLLPCEHTRQKSCHERFGAGLAATDFGHLRLLQRSALHAAAFDPFGAEPDSPSAAQRNHPG